MVINVKNTKNRQSYRTIDYEEAIKSLSHVLDQNFSLAISREENQRLIESRLHNMIRPKCGMRLLGILLNISYAG